MRRSELRRGDGSRSGAHRLRYLVVPGVVGLILGIVLVGDFAQRALFRWRVTSARIRELPGRPTISFDRKRRLFFSGCYEAVKDMVRDVVQELPRGPADRALLESGLPVYDLEFDAKDRRQLWELAEKIRLAGSSTGFQRPYVRARFRAGAAWRDVEVKLRGLLSAHYIPGRPSLRIKFPKNRPFEGRRRINLLDPYDKGVAADVTTKDELARHGLLDWTSRFVVLRIHGEVVGLFQEIEQFGRAMTDRAGRPEGSIFGGDGELLDGGDGAGPAKARGAVDWLLECQRTSSIEGDSGDCGWATVSQSIDVDKFAWATAMTTLLGSWHAWKPDNVRMYFDPARGQLEPIPWDYNTYRLPGRDPGLETAQGIAEWLLAKPEFRHLRNQKLWSLIQERVGPLAESARQLESSLGSALAHDSRSKWSRIRPRDLAGDLESNGALLARWLSQPDLRASICHGVDRRHGVVIENQGPAAVQWNSGHVEYGEEVLVPVFDGTPVIDGAWRGKPGVLRLDLRVPEGETHPIGFGALRLTGENLVTGEVVEHREPRPQQASIDCPDSALQTPRWALLDLPPNFRLEGTRVIVGPGRVELLESLEISRPYSLVLQAGLDLHLGQGVSLIVHGDLVAEGTREEPIRVSGGEGRSTWGVLAVQGERLRPSRVRLAHVRLDGGSTGETRRVVFHGALSAVDADVELRNSTFRGAQGEDGINLRYCEVSIEDCQVTRSASDAIDLDFCRGSLRGSRVSEAGGDGIDLSGSEMDLRAISIRECADKGVSVGERSSVVAQDLTIERCTTGLAAKDGSRLTLSASVLSDLDAGVSAYRKKLTFGAPVASLSSVTMRRVDSALVRDPDSTIRVTGDRD